MATSTKQFLYSIRDETNEVKELELRIRELRSRVEGMKAITYDKPRVRTSPEGMMENAIADVLEYEEKLREKVERLTYRRRMAQEIIDTLEDTKERQVLDIYFLDEGRIRMETVAEMIGYSERRTYDIYKAALSHLPDSIATT